MGGGGGLELMLQESPPAPTHTPPILLLVTQDEGEGGEAWLHWRAQQGSSVVKSMDDRMTRTLHRRGSWRLCRDMTSLASQMEKNMYNQMDSEVISEYSQHVLPGPLPFFHVAAQ